MTTFPETIILNTLKLYRGMGTMTVDEIAAETLVRISQEGWKFIPATPEPDILEKTGLSAKQYLLLFSALKER